MRNNVFIARLAHGAVVSTMAACLMPQSHTDEATSPAVGHEAAFTDRTSTPDDGTQQGPEQVVTVTMSKAVSEWDKQMEREFRKLALEEAKGTLTAEQASRLEELNLWRDRLLNPQPAEEMLRQIKRDRLLERMEELLKEYVEFQEAAGKKRAAA
jgi:hypothetical protein